jgi:hypothetical protein
MRVAAQVDRPIEPPVQAPVQAPAGDEEMARQLHEELHDGEDFDEEEEGHQGILLRMVAAVSGDATRQVIRRLNRQRGNRVMELTKVFNILYQAISTDGLLETETTTERLHRQLADNLVRVATNLVQLTTRRVVRDGARADVAEEIYGTLVVDAQYLRNHVHGVE